MNKRSAMLMAAGLVLTLIVGGVAMSVGLTGPTPSEAGPRAEPDTKSPEPIIKTVKRIVTVHKPGATTPATTTGSSGSAGSPSGSTDDDDHSGSHHGDDDHGDHHGEDDHGDDDQSVTMMVMTTMATMTTPVTTTMMTTTGWPR